MAALNMLWLYSHGMAWAPVQLHVHTGIHSAVAAPMHIKLVAPPAGSRLATLSAGATNTAVCAGQQPP
jgi:hypothetical protein